MALRALAAFAALGMLLAACNGKRDTTQAESSGSAAAQPSPAGCPRVHPARARSRPLPGFVPPSRAGLWLPNDRCVYLVFAGGQAASPLWRSRPGEHVRGLSWAPDGESFAVTTEA